MPKKLSASLSKYSDDMEKSSPLQPCPLEEHVEKLEYEDKPNEMGERKRSLKYYIKNTCRFIFSLMQTL